MRNYGPAPPRGGAVPRVWLALVREAGLDEAFEKGVRLVRFALEFRMILAGQEIRVIPQLDQFRERAVR